MWRVAWKPPLGEHWIYELVFACNSAQAIDLARARNRSAKYGRDHRASPA